MTIHKFENTNHRLTEQQLLRAVWIAVALLIVLLASVWAASAQSLEASDHASAQTSSPALAAGGRSSSKSFTALTAGYLALSGADFYLSNRCISAGRCVEIGSYRGVANHPVLFAATKMAASSALAATAWAIRKKHPKAAWGVLVGLTVAQGAVVVWNAQQGRGR